MLVRTCQLRQPRGKLWRMAQIALHIIASLEPSSASIRVRSIIESIQSCLIHGVLYHICGQRQVCAVFVHGPRKIVT